MKLKPIHWILIFATAGLAYWFFFMRKPKTAPATTPPTPNAPPDSVQSGIQWIPEETVPLLERGVKGANATTSLVAKLQEQINKVRTDHAQQTGYKYTYPKITVDGYFGDATREALKLATSKSKTATDMNSIEKIEKTIFLAPNSPDYFFDKYKYIAV